MLRAAFKGLFSILALVIGGSIIGWVLYNEVVERLPQYRRPPLVGTFGISACHDSGRPALGTPGACIFPEA
jgi:hypothetical protein